MEWGWCSSKQFGAVAVAMVLISLTCVFTPIPSFSGRFTEARLPAAGLAITRGIHTADPIPSSNELSDRAARSPREQSRPDLAAGVGLPSFHKKKIADLSEPIWQLFRRAQVWINDYLSFVMLPLFIAVAAMYLLRGMMWALRVDHLGISPAQQVPSHHLLPIQANSPPTF